MRVVVATAKVVEMNSKDKPYILAALVSDTLDKFKAC